jgi:predicted metal-dependent phosphoesterase TrpH
MKLDAHVHTQASGMTKIWPLDRVIRESYNTPEQAYRLAKARGMDLVAITDHDQIAGALSLAHYPDVIVGCEVSAQFPGEPVQAHLGVLDITEAQFAEIQRRRHDVAELLPYLRAEGIFTILNHVASQVNGRMTAAHIAALVPWVDAFEVINGSRLPSQNCTAMSLAHAHHKASVAGSDAHTGRGIGRTYTIVDGAATRAEFMQGLREGRARVGGRHGNYFTMASDLVRISSRFYAERTSMFVRRPHDWRRQAFVLGALLGAPLNVLPLLYVAGHFISESRFNQSLVRELIARPALARAAMADFARAV